MHFRKQGIDIQATLFPCLQVPREVLLPEGVTHVAAGNGHTLFLTESSSVWAVGNNSYGQLGLGMRDKITSLPRRLQSLIGAQWVFSCMETHHCWATSSSIQMHVVAESLCGHCAGCKIIAISAGAHHSLAISSDGELFTWGSGLRGCLGNYGSQPGAQVP